MSSMVDGRWSPRKRAPRTHPLAVEPQPDGERDAEDDGEAREERVAAAVAQRGVHLLAEEWEDEAEH